MVGSYYNEKELEDMMKNVREFAISETKANIKKEIELYAQWWQEDAQIELDKDKPNTKPIATQTKWDMMILETNAEKIVNLEISKKKNEVDKNER